jgi:hypothetical protein
MNKRTLTQLGVLTIVILLIWFLPDLLGQRLNNVIMSWIAGWQLGGWAYELGEWIYARTNDK